MLLRTLLALLLCATAQAFLVANAPLAHRPVAARPAALSTVTMEESSLDKISKVTLGGTLVGVLLVGCAALTSATGSPPGGLAFAASAFVVMKLAADADGLENPEPNE